MKNTLLILFVMSIFFASCTEKSFQVIGAVLPEPEIENNDLFDPNCVPGDVVLDSLYLNEATHSMLPYENTSRLAFKSESGGSVILYKKATEPSYRREITEKYCVNADREWSVGSEVTEHLMITYEGTLPSGEDISINGYMHKEKTWFSDNTKETGYYDDLQIRVSIAIPNSVHYRSSTIKATSWFDDSIVSIEDTGRAHIDEQLTTVTLNGREFDNVVVNNTEFDDEDMKLYTQKDVGVIGFVSAAGDLFVIQ